ncbi:MAG TPA: hypothetical protein VGE98_00105 [Thermoanaerobaculia bacterium]
MAKNRQTAQELVQRIRQLAELEARQLVDRDPALGWVRGRLRRWISSLQIACVALALSREKDNPEVLELVEGELERWDPTVVEALMSFYSFIDGLLRDDLTTAMGLWVLWRTRRGEGSADQQEDSLASEIGYRCVDVAAKWNLTPAYEM